MLRVALPNKGTLAEPAAQMMREAGYRQRTDSRDLSIADEDNNIEFFYLRPKDIATYVGSGDLDLTVPPNGILYLSSGEGPTVALVGLTEDIGPGESIDVTFTFEEAGEITIPVPVGVPTRDLPRGEEFDFHGEEEVAGEEGTVEESSGQEAREQESAEGEG